MTVHCSICKQAARDREITVRSGKTLALWRCDSCDFDFFDHDPTTSLAANKLDESRLKAAGLDIPTVERDFANGLAQSQPYIDEYVKRLPRGASVLEIGCSWGYFLKLARDAGMDSHGLEVNSIRAKYVSEKLGIPCDESLEACEARGIRFDKIFLFYVLEYVPDPTAYLQRLVGLLNPGGEIVVVTPNLNDALKDLWQNTAFGKFFYDEHAINYLSPRSIDRIVDRLTKSTATVETRQGYSFVNHVSWFLTNAPRTTGIVGGDGFIKQIGERLRSVGAPQNRTAEPKPGLARELADLIDRMDVEYRQVLERGRYGNQIRFVVRR